MDVPISEQGHGPPDDEAPRSGNAANGADDSSIDRFSIVRKIGEGGMGEVFLARHPVTGMEVAIKRLRPTLVADPLAVRRFLAEARHIYHLNHPRILRIMEVWDPPAGPYYVMPYMPAGPLSSVIREGQSTDYVLTLTVARDLAAGLAYAHEKGIIHRDLKPANVLMGPDGHALLGDFGLVREFSTNDSVVDGVPHCCEGTAPYMSPAVARGEVEDTRCDIYSFGALVYELLTGHRPYGEAAEPMSKTLQAIAAGPPPPVFAHNPNAPTGLTAVVNGCMARELHQRYAKMADVVADMDLLAAGKMPLGPHRKRQSSPRWRKTAAVVALVLALMTWGVDRLFLQSQRVDLLSLLDIDKDASTGVTRGDHGVLTLTATAQDPRAWVRFPYIPHGEYDLVVEFSRVSGDDGLDQCLSYDDHGFCWTLGGVHNTTSSFWWVGTGGFGNNATAVSNSSVIKNATHHRSEVKVRSGRVIAYLDGVKISEYKTNYLDVHFPLSTEIPDVWGKRLGLSILNSEFEVYQFQVIEHPSLWSR